MISLNLDDELKPVPQSAYIEIIGDRMSGRHDLQDWELRSIGEFTRENVTAWLESRNGADWVGVTPAKDFHAVCGEIEIPWATERHRLNWELSHKRDGVQQYILHTEPAQVEHVAEQLRQLSFEVRYEGKEHVYFDSRMDHKDVLITLRDKGLDVQDNDLR